MSDASLLHRALYYALLDIRARGREGNDKVVFHLADLFHNVVLRTGDAAEGKRDYSDVLASLKRNAETAGCSQWLENVLAQIERAGDDQQRDASISDRHS